jgi:acyl phosphate:glycerol-3-phosphate acyltransferase
VSTLAFAVVGYLAGSIPTGYWLVRALRGEDIRRVGSGNIGATNV